LQIRSSKPYVTATAVERLDAANTTQRERPRHGEVSEMITGTGRGVEDEVASAGSFDPNRVYRST
jgi:hypothetical protein